MKKLLFISVLLCLAIGANAQKWQHGVKAGMNISTETLPDNSQSTINKGFAVGFNVGAVINYNINERFAVEADLMYSRQGCKEISVLCSYPPQYIRDSSSHSHYLVLPVAGKVNIYKGLYAECGPQIGFLCEKNYEGNSTLEYEKRFDFSLFGGIGYKITKNLYVDARYVHGFTGTPKRQGGEKNRNIQISVGFYL